MCTLRLEIEKLQQIIDNHDSGYLRMAAQLYVHVHSGKCHILTKKDTQPKTDGTDEI